MANQSKSIKEYFEQLQSIQIPRKRSEFFPPLKDEQISNYEEKNQMLIPESYKEWLRLSNGGILFGGRVQLYGIDNPPKPSMGYDFSEGMVPNEYLIIGFSESEHICYNKTTKKFFFYEYQDPTTVLEECVQYDYFKQIIEYIIDIETN